MKNAASKYQQMSAHSQVMDANPHKLILMLIDGALNKIALAKGCIENNDIGGKGVNISLAVSIIGALESSLDFEKGGEIAKNLGQLYEYMHEKLLEANLNSNSELLDEVARLINTIREGWVGIEEEANKIFNKDSKE